MTARIPGGGHLSVCPGLYITSPKPYTWSQGLNLRSPMVVARCAVCAHAHALSPKSRHLNPTETHLAVADGGGQVRGVRHGARLREHGGGRIQRLRLGDPVHPVERVQRLRHNKRV